MSLFLCMLGDHAKARGQRRGCAGFPLYANALYSHSSGEFTSTILRILTEPDNRVMETL